MSMFMDGEAQVFAVKWFLIEHFVMPQFEHNSHWSGSLYE